jgi:hypothetical protein
MGHQMYYRFSQNQLMRIGNNIHLVGLEEMAGTPAEIFSRVRTSLISLFNEIKLFPHFRNVISEDCGYSEDEVGCFKGLQLLERIRLSYSASGCPLKDEPGDREYALLLMQWSVLYVTHRAEKIAKYLSCNAFSYITRQELLDPIELPFGWIRYALGGGSWRSWIRLLRRKWSSGNKEELLTAAQAFLYLKKGTPVVSDHFVKESLIKHRKALSEERVVEQTLSYLDPDSGKCEVILLRREMKKRIRGIVDYIRSGRQIRYDEHFWEPSPNASYLKSRSKGGQASDLRWERDEDTLEQKWFEGGLCSYPRITDDLRIEREFKCRAVPICEPFKVRVITKGPAEATYALKGLQLALWKQMKSKPIFELIGRTVKPDDIPHLHPGESWLSGDFSAATDNLAAWCSRTVAKELAKQFCLPEKLLVDSLCNNLIDYGSEDENLRPFLQKNGQLMGSVLSFLVLNIVNAALLWLVKCPAGPWNLTEMSFRVNGDDAIAALDVSEKDRWYRVSTALGLIPSVGKTYYSGEFCIINSTCFCKCDEGIKEVPFLNGDYLQRRQGKGGEERSVLDLAAINHKFLECGRSEEEKDMLAGFFLECHRDLLESDAAHCDWFLPKSVGGLGLRRVGDDPVELSGHAHLRAFAVISGWDPVEKELKDRWKDKYCIRKSEVKPMLDAMGFSRRPRLIKYSAPEWELERRPICGVSSLIVQSITGRVVRDDCEKRVIKEIGKIPHYLRNQFQGRRSFYALLCRNLDASLRNLLNCRLRSSTCPMEDYFSQENAFLYERYVNLPQYQEMYEWGREAIKVDECVIPEWREIDSFLCKELQGTVVDDPDLNESLKVKIETPKVLGLSSYQAWLWGKANQWMGA